MSHKSKKGTESRHLISRSSLQKTARDAHAASEPTVKATKRLSGSTLTQARRDAEVKKAKHGRLVVFDTGPSTKRLAYEAVIPNSPERKAALEARARKARLEVRYGNAVLYADALAPGIVQRKVITSTDALKRTEKRLVTPGVKIRSKKGVPLYSLDANNPSIMIRKLNGETTRGRFIDGRFKAEP